MALMKCEECGGKVSSRAAACPNCGDPVRRRSSPSTKGLVLEDVVTLATEGPLGWIQATIFKTTMRRPIAAGTTHLLFLLGLTIGYQFTEGASYAYVGGGGDGALFGLVVCALIGFGLPTALWLGVMLRLRKG